MKNHPDDFPPFAKGALTGQLRYLHSMGATEVEAWDAVQHAFTEAYATWSTIEHPQAWVRTVARHRFISTRRADRDRERHLTAHAVDIVPAAAESAETAALEHVDVLRLVARLPTRQSAVFRLYLDGYGNDEIAHTLGLAVGTVRSHLRHARDRLRALLAAEGEPEGDMT